MYKVGEGFSTNVLTKIDEIVGEKLINIPKGECTISDPDTYAEIISNTIGYAEVRVVDTQHKLKIYVEPILVKYSVMHADYLGYPCFLIHNTVDVAIES